MDANDGGLSSYYHHHHHHSTAASSSSASPVNGIFAPSSPADGSPLLFPHSLSGRASAAPAPVSTEPVRRKRGRPRKYGPSPSTSISAIKNVSASAPLPSSPDSSSRKKETSSSKKAQLGALGNAGQGFTPHVITIAAGEDVGQKIILFMQQRKQAVCILSASGSISNASLRQPAMLGGNVTYEGRFEILSLSGSFLHTETGGASSRPGGLCVCLSGTDGRIVGGGVGGPLVAAGPVQVIVCSFLIETDTDLCASTKVDTSNKMPMPIPPGTTLASPVTIRSTADSTGRITTCRGSDDRLNMGGIGSNCILQYKPMQVMPSRSPADWIGGRHESGDGGCLSPEVEEEEHIRD